MEANQQKDYQEEPIEMAEIEINGKYENSCSTTMFNDNNLSNYFESGW
jgi:hypothetical protein